ncbi:MAG: chitobiase/beta-hexosaminidase C-terminal domain-containing protein [Armatimonadota bacterium]
MKWKRYLTDMDVMGKILAMVTAIVFCSSCTSTRAISTPLCTLTWGSTNGMQNIDTCVALDGIYVYGNSTDVFAGTGMGGGDLQRDVWIMKFDLNAQLAWTRKIGTDQPDSVSYSDTFSNGEIILVGTTYGSLYAVNSGGSNVFAVCYTLAGSVKWSKQLDTPNSNVGGLTIVSDKANIEVVDNNGLLRLVQLSSTTGQILQNVSIDNLARPTGASVRNAFYNDYGTINYLYNTYSQPVGVADLFYVYIDSVGVSHTVAVPYLQGASSCIGQPNHTIQMAKLRVYYRNGNLSVISRSCYHHDHSAGAYDTNLISLSNISPTGQVTVKCLDENKMPNMASGTIDANGDFWTGWDRVGNVYDESTSAENYCLYGASNPEYYETKSAYKVVQYSSGLASKVYEGDVTVTLPGGMTADTGELVHIGSSLFWVAPVNRVVNDVDESGVMVYKFDAIATPTYSLASGTYTGTQSVSITCTTSGAQIRYTTDGSEPTETSSLYTGPISISTNKTVKSRAFVTGMVPSLRADATYVIRKTISGSLTLGNYSGLRTGLIATIVLRRSDGTVLQTTSATLNSSGAYSLLTEHEGAMDILIRVPRWLRKKASIDVTGSTTVNMTLKNGDADGGNSVNLFDYVVLDNAYGTQPGDPAWNQMADLDGGNTVNSFDYTIIDMNFNAQGDN